MARGGFDAVIGNPPWERFAAFRMWSSLPSRDGEIVATLQGRTTKNHDKGAEDGRPWNNRRRGCLEEFESRQACSPRRRAYLFPFKTGRFPLTGTSGKINTYALFAEHFSRLARAPQKPEPAGSIAQVITDTGGVRPPPPGRAGVIVPTGIATDSSTSAFFGDLIARNRLSALYDFENRDKLFPGVHSSYKFSILAIGPSGKARFAAFLLNTQALRRRSARSSWSRGISS